MKWLIQFILIFITLLTFGAKAVDDECKVWFDHQKINPNDKDCELKCSMADVNMGTFTCPTACKDLCGDPKVLWGSFCVAEVMLAAVDLKTMLFARDLATEAQETTIKLFKKNGWKNESDALRHFYWSALLTKRFGKTIAKMITDAHESCSGKNLDSEKDLYNNSLGIEAGACASKEELLKIAKKKYFEEKRFKIIAPQPNFSVDNINWSL